MEKNDPCMDWLNIGKTFPSHHETPTSTALPVKSDSLNALEDNTRPSQVIRYVSSNQRQSQSKRLSKELSHSESITHLNKKKKLSELPNHFTSSKLNLSLNESVSSDYLLDNLKNAYDPDQSQSSISNHLIEGCLKDNVINVNNINISFDQTNNYGQCSLKNEAKLLYQMSRKQSHHTVRCPIIDRLNFHTLGHFVTIPGDPVGHVNTYPSHRPPLLNRDNESLFKRYFKKKIRTKENVQTNKTTSLTELTQRCSQNPLIASHWLALSRQELKHHISGFSVKDRLNRRLSIIKTGLENCHWDISLIMELLKIIQLRDPAENVEDSYNLILRQLIGDTIFVENFKQHYKETIEDTQENEFDYQNIMLLPGSSKPNPSILLGYIQFLQSSFSQFSFNSFLTKIVPYLSNLIILSFPKKFDQTPEDIDIDRNIKTRRSWELVGIELIRILIDGCQWKLLIPVIQLLGHLDFILTKHQCGTNKRTLEQTLPSKNQFNKLMTEITEFWESDAPRLLQPFAADMYTSLLKCSYSSLYSAARDVQANDDLYLGIINDMFQQSNLEKSITTDDLHPLKWFYLEELYDEHLGNFCSQENIKINYKEDTIQYTLNPKCLYLEPDFYSVLELFLNIFIFSMSGNELRYVLLDSLGCPMTLSRFSSNYKKYRESKTVNSSNEDLLIATITGVLRRLRMSDSQTFHLCNHDNRSTTAARSLSLIERDDVNLLFDQDSLQTQSASSLFLSDLFGYDVSVRVSSNISFFIMIGKRLNDTLHHIFSNKFISTDTYLDPASLSMDNHTIQLLFDKMKHDIYNHAQKTSSFMSFYIMLLGQISIWCPDDMVVLSALIGLLTYKGDTKFARKLLRYHETKTSLWVTFATCKFLRQPDLFTLRKVRHILTRYFLNLKNTNVLHFVTSVIRLELLGLLQLQTVQTKKTYLEVSSLSSVPPSILHLCCAFSDYSIEGWDFYCREFLEPAENLYIAGTQFTISDHPWNSKLSPAPLRLRSALMLYEKQLSLMNSNINDPDSTSSTINNQMCPLSVNSFYTFVLAITLLTAAIKQPIDAWKRFEEFLPKHQTIIWDSERDAHDLETIFDVLLLTIITSSPIQGLSAWPIDLIHAIVLRILEYFPKHQRAYWVITKIYTKRSSILSLRCFMSRVQNVVSEELCLKSFLITELETGFPSYKRIEDIFEHFIMKGKLTSTLWDVYISFLYLCWCVGSTLLSGLPVDNTSEMKDILKEKLSTVIQRARFACPASKRLWMHSFYLLHGILTKNNDEATIVEERYLNDVELSIRKYIPFYLDPLELLNNTST